MSDGYRREGKPNVTKADSGFLADGTPWIRWSALQKAKRDQTALGKRIIAMRDELLKQRSKTVSEISPETIEFVRKQRALAQAAGTDNPVEAIHKANRDPVLSPTHYADLQRRVALANAIEIAKVKGNVPEVVHAENTGIDDDDEDDGKKRAKKCDQLIKFYMSQGDSFDVAASKAHWDEQAAKAQSDPSSHNGENARAERRMTGENLNPRPLSP